MKYKIVDYIPIVDCHKGEDEKGDIKYIDIIVCGDLDVPDFENGEEKNAFMESFIGKTVSCGFEHAYITILHEVSIES